MNYNEMTQAVRQAQETIRLADIANRKLAGNLVGRLRCSEIPGYVLRRLKRELQDYNMTTGEWK